MQKVCAALLAITLIAGLVPSAIAAAPAMLDCVTTPASDDGCCGGGAGMSDAACAMVCAMSCPAVVRLRDDIVHQAATEAPAGPATASAHPLLFPPDPAPPKATFR